LELDWKLWWLELEPRIENRELRTENWEQRLNSLN
jgi:hypothetical protein